MEEFIEPVYQAVSPETKPKMSKEKIIIIALAVACAGAIVYCIILKKRLKSKPKDNVHRSRPLVIQDDPDEDEDEDFNDAPGNTELPSHSDNEEQEVLTPDSDIMAVLNKIRSGEITRTDAAKELGVSRRTIGRYYAKYIG